jgi:hypothetical protein
MGAETPSVAERRRAQGMDGMVAVAEPALAQTLAARPYLRLAAEDIGAHRCTHSGWVLVERLRAGVRVHETVAVVAVASAHWSWCVVQLPSTTAVMCVVVEACWCHAEHGEACHLREGAMRMAHAALHPDSLRHSQVAAYSHGPVAENGTRAAAIGNHRRLRRPYPFFQ